MKRIACFALLFASTTAYAQTRQTVSQPLQWFSLSSNVKLGQKFSLFVDTHYRYVGSMEPMQFQLRFSGDITVKDWFVFSPLGYVYVVNPLYGVQPAGYPTKEHRIYQQFYFKHYWSSVRIQHRLRTEERFMEYRNAEGNYEGYSNDQFRVRYRLLFNIPLNNHQEGSYKSGFEPHTWYVQCYDEIFMSWGEKVTYHEPDQNRVFAGIGYQFSPKLSMQAGALWQALVKSNGAKQENNVGSSVSLTYNFDFSRQN